MKKRKLFPIPLFLLGAFIFFSSCTLFKAIKNPISFFSPSSNKDPDFIVNFQYPSWYALQSYDADYVWRHSESQSLLMSNSDCRKEHEKKSLHELSSGLLSQLRLSKNSTHTFSVKKLMWRDFPAMEKVLATTVEGDAVLLNILTVKKGVCVYDFVLIYPHKGLKMSNEFKSIKQKDWSYFLDSSQWKD